MTSIADALTRLRTEFAEMPGLNLKATQVQRLCGIDSTTCRVVLDVLVDLKFLCLKPNGSYARAADSLYRAVPEIPKAALRRSHHARTA